jgi:hypothetical protein
VCQGNTSYYLPAKIVKQGNLQAGQLVEFVLATEDEQQFVKVRKVLEKL